MADYIQNYVHDNYPVYPLTTGTDIAHRATADPAAGARSLPEYIKRHSNAQQAYTAAYKQLLAMGNSASVAQGGATTVKRGVYIRHEVEAQTADRSPDLTTAKGRAIAASKERVDLALIAQDVYYDHGIPALLPSNTIRLSDAQVADAFGIDPGLLRDKKSGFFASVYHDQSKDRYIVALRGSDELVDFTDSNIPNGLQLQSAQHHNAARLADAFNKGQVSKPVILVGHSLGGSLASLQSLATGWQATSFNASSVEPATLARFNLDTQNASARITAYYIPGEVASLAQDHLIIPKTPQQIMLDFLTGNKEQRPYYDPLSSALGQRKPLTPVAVGKAPTQNEPLQPGSPLNELSAAVRPIGSHYMESILESTFYEFNAVAGSGRNG